MPCSWGEERIKSLLGVQTSSWSTIVLYLLCIFGCSITVIISGLSTFCHPLLVWNITWNGWADFENPFFNHFKSVHMFFYIQKTTQLYLRVGWKPGINGLAWSDCCSYCISRGYLECRKMGLQMSEFLWVLITEEVRCLKCFQWNKKSLQDVDTKGFLTTV